MGVKTRNLGNSEGKDIQWQAALSGDRPTIFDLDAGKGLFFKYTRRYHRGKIYNC